MPFNVGPVELIIVLIIALLVVGPRRLPEMGNALGRTIREFRKASSDVTDAVSLDSDDKGGDAPKPNTLQGEAKPNTPSHPIEPTAAGGTKTDRDS
jgi:TatA/E family protein of Tat protein translocase